MKRCRFFSWRFWCDDLPLTGRSRHILLLSKILLLFVLPLFFYFFKSHPRMRENWGCRRSAEPTACIPNPDLKNALADGRNCMDMEAVKPHRVTHKGCPKKPLHRPVHGLGRIITFFTSGSWFSISSKALAISPSGRRCEINGATLTWPVCSRAIAWKEFRTEV